MMGLPKCRQNGDGIPENVPLSPARAVPVTLETIGGNYVILALGNGRFACYAHLQPGSLCVKPGDRLVEVQVRRVGVAGIEIRATLMASP